MNAQGTVPDLSFEAAASRSSKSTSRLVPDSRKLLMTVSNIELPVFIETPSCEELCGTGFRVYQGRPESAVAIARQNAYALRWCHRGRCCRPDRRGNRIEQGYNERHDRARAGGS